MRKTLFDHLLVLQVRADKWSKRSIRQTIKEPVVRVVYRPGGLMKDQIFLLLINRDETQIFPHALGMMDNTVFQIRKLPVK